VSRRKLGVWDKAIRDAAKELGEPKDSFVVEKYAHLATELKLRRLQWASGKASNSADMIAIMAEMESMRRQRGKDAVTDIRVNIVEGVKARCPHCGKTSDIPPELMQNDSRNTHAAPLTPPADSTRVPDHGNGSEGLSSGEPAPAPVEPMPSQYVEGKSPSAFNSQRGVPLKRLQSGIHPLRSLSPLSH
jgi:hypothetical protein